MCLFQVKNITKTIYRDIRIINKIMSKKDNFITVTDLNVMIKDTLTTKFSSQLKVKGELSNIKASGPHTYLTLKDDDSSISITAWNTKFPNLKNGDDVIVTGKIACFLKGGSYQVSATKIERIGVGHLHEILEQNKKMFTDKGYFSKSTLQLQLPTTINRIGILTASGGAALHDILYVLEKNMFFGEVCIKNCSVQGQMCPESVANGILFFNNLHETKPIDVLIIARGGGSFEDLIGYSSKEVVKAIHKTNVYTISAVGHEVDTMLSDYSANYRAPTPSIAGEVVSSVQKRKKEQLVHCAEHMLIVKMQIKNKLENYVNALQSHAKLLKSMDPINYLTNELNKFARIKIDLEGVLQNAINKKLNEIEKLSNLNESFNPAKTFENGYVAIIDEQNNLINTLELFNAKIKENQKLKIVFTDGEAFIPIK